MALETKNLNRGTKLKPQTIDDKQNSNNNDTVDRLITAGLVIAGGATLYKSGLLRKPIHGLKEFGSLFAEASNQGYHSTKIIKEWANSPKISRPDRSLFNARKSASLGYDLWNDLRESLSRGELYASNTRRIINDTVEDINLLNSMIQKEMRGYSSKELDEAIKQIEKNFDGQPKEIIDAEIEKVTDELKKSGKELTRIRNYSIKNASILEDIFGIKTTTSAMYRENMGMAADRITTELTESFVNKNILTKEMAEKQLRLTGYRNLTLGDIFDSYDFKEHSLVFKKEFLDEDLEKTIKNFYEKTNINLGESINKEGTTILNELNSFLADSRFKYIEPGSGSNPMSLAFYENIWKNISLDSSLNIDENGKIINYMMGKDAITFFGNSLRKDFGLPALGFNPLDSAIKVIPFLDKRLNNREASYAFINGIGNYNPFISGYGTRNVDDISTSLQKRFNNFDEDFHLLFANNNLYALGTKGTKEFLGSDFNAYNIKGAEKGYQMPHVVEMIRTMGGYDLNKDPMREVLEELGNKAIKEFDPHMTVQEYEKTFNIKLTNSQKLKYEIGRRLDLGYQEFRNSLSDNDYADISQRTNIDNFFDDIINSIIRSDFLKTNGFQYASYEEAATAVRDKTYELAFGNTFKEYINNNGTRIRPDTFVVTKRGIDLKDLIEDVKLDNGEKFIDDAEGFVKQYFSGFGKDYKIDKYFSEKSIPLYDVFNALDSGFASIGLGLSLESKKSTKDLVGNLLLKRALPAYMLTQIPGMIDYFSEPLFTNKQEKEQGINDTVTKTFVRDILKPIDIGAHILGDVTGFTKLFKKLQELTPGSEHFTELPVIYQLGLGQSAEERQEYIEKGYDPVRKNRYWSISNTPFTGAKIDHWRPNLYRRIEADVKFSDTMYGSRKEYYDNTWYPNLVNPFAPINHFLLDPDHWDKKHYYDRPYAETAPKGENIPLIGPLVSGTIGQVYRHRMHQEYWNGNNLLPINPEDEKPSRLLSTGISSNFDVPKNSFSKQIKEVVQNAFNDTNTFNQINANANEQYIKAANQRITDIEFIRTLLNKNVYVSDNTFSNFKNTPLYDNAIKSYTVAYNPNTSDYDLIPTLPYSDDEKLFTKAKEYSSPLQTSTLPYRDYNRYDTALDVYITPSGQVNVVDVPENLNLYKVNQEIKHYSLNKIYGTNQRVNISEYEKGYEQLEEKPADSNLMFSIGQEFNDLSNIYGLRGFMIQTMFTGEANTGITKVENSSYTYSANRSFWDQNLGGLGGELSEISRRFIHKKDKNIEYLNPIRNTMPTWLPGSNYFTDFLHGDPYSKIMNGEERLPGEGYERLNNIEFSLNISSSMLGNSRAAHVKHFLKQDTNLTYEDEKEVKRLRGRTNEKEITEDNYKIQNLNKAEEIISKILDHFREADILLDANYKFYDQQNDISGQIDAKIKDYHSRTGESLINIRGVSDYEFNRLKAGHDIRKQDYYEMNYSAYINENTKGNNYIYYYNKENPEDIYKAKIKFREKDLRASIQNLNDARKDIYNGLKSGEISRGDLYSLVEKYKILADVAPYSQEFKDISAQVSHAHLTESQKIEIKSARERMQAQKEPLRVYDYKFKTSNLKSEKVTVKKVIDNNTFITEEYGKEHAIKFAGINVSESNTTLYAPTVKEKKVKNKETGRQNTIRKGKTMNKAANDEISKYLKPGQKITISYDADERNKYNKDSTQSIRAVVTSHGRNINRRLVSKGLAKEKESDESPAGIHVKYSSGEIAFGSMWETLAHGASHLPFIGDKFFQIRSPYEQYRKREVYNKDFKTWNHPIRDYLIPTINETSAQNPIAGIVTGAFIGSLFGRKPYGKFIGTIVGATIPAIGQTVHALGSDKDHEWRPYRRRQQEEINTYIDTLKYVKNIKLYNQYKELAKKKDHFDVDAYLEKQEQKGEENKQRVQELNNYKRLVKLDFKHRGNYNFKYGEPKYAESDMTRKETITAINKELAEIGSDRRVEKLPLNAIKAISYKQASEKTMYGFEPGDDIRNIMSSLPKKERQYYSKLVEAPEEEKEKILRIAPSYLRRALQASWGMHVDEKPELTEYFKNHALPEENWVGWDENTDLEDVKVKIINANGLDPGEYDIWNNNKRKADEVNIPIPRVNIRNTDPNAVQARLSRILNNNGFDNVQVYYINSINGNNTIFDIQEDARNEVDNQIKNLEV